MSKDLTNKILHFLIVQVIAAGILAAANHVTLLVGDLESASGQNRQQGVGAALGFALGFALSLALGFALSLALGLAPSR